MRACGGALLIAGLLGASGVARAAAEAIVLVRHHPIRVKWGEASVVEGGRVRARAGDAEKEFEESLGLVLTLRTRTEDLDRLRAGSRRAESQASPVGSLFLAASFDEGRPSWNAFRDKLVAEAGQLEPPAYADFLRGFETWIQNSAPPDSGPYSLVYCSVMPGGPERAWEVNLEEARDPDRRTVRRQLGMTALGDSAPVCSALRAALEHAAPSEVTTTPFQVEQTAIETLRVATVDRSGEPPGPWPGTAKVGRRESPAGATSYESTGTEYGQLRRSAEGGPSGGKPYLLVAETAPAELSTDLIRGRAILARWSWSIEAKQLGASPRALANDRGELLYGLFPRSAAGEPSFDALAAAVAGRLERLDRLVDADSVKEALIEENESMRVDEVLAVICTPDERGVDRASYCLAKSCSEVLDAGEVCTTVRRLMGG